VIYGGVNYRNFQGREKEGERIREKLGLGSAPLLLTVSRLVKRKGHDLVMKALAQIRPRFPQARYAVVGDGPEREALFSLAQRLGLSEHVIFAGSVPDHDLPAWYAACDVFVMPSRDIAGQPPEGLGLVYLEANAAGKPVIGARTGGVPDAIVHEQTGLLVDPEDVKALAAAIQRLIEHPAEAGRMGETGRQRVLREFTWHAVAERFLSALSETLSDKWQYP
jgi:phosphatidylinositol alpha-1,6-mannosyltransferase